MANPSLRSPAKPTKKIAGLQRLGLTVLQQNRRLADALSLQSDKYFDQRTTQQDPSTMGDTELSDDSISSSGDAPRRSVLDLGTKSYAKPEGEEPSTMGGGLQEGTSSDIARTRALQEAMMLRQSQFVAAETGTRQQTAQAQTGATQPEQTEENEDTEDEDERAQQLMQDKAQQLRQQAEKKARDKTAKERAQQIQEKMKQRMNKATKTASRLTLEGAEVATSEVIVPLLILIAQLNVQMIMKYFFKPMLLDGRFGNSVDNAMKGAPWIDQSLVEDIITVNIDIILTCAGICCNPCCLPFVVLAIISTVITNPGSALKAVIQQ
ncbi:hypothetical protein KBC54_01135 [Patescibacteria group bacterium]|nr:hypothetical protein [Patescibacteria group bacterium]